MHSHLALQCWQGCLEDGIFQEAVPLPRNTPQKLVALKLMLATFLQNQSSSWQPTFWKHFEKGQGLISTQHHRMHHNGAQPFQRRLLSEAWQGHT